MKKLLSVLLAGVMTIALVGCGGNTTTQDKLEEIKKAGKIVMGTSPDFPPNEFYMLDENGNKQIAGNDIALGQAIADKIGVKLEIKATDFDGVLANIQSGTIDMGISGFAQTDERAKTMQFSIGYQREDDGGFQGLLVNKQFLDKYKTLDEVKAANLKIAAQTASVQYEMAVKITNPKNVKQYATTDAAALALNSGDVDAMVVSTTQAEPMLSSFTNLMILPKETFNLDPEAKYSTNVIGFPSGEEYASLVELANEVIKEAKANGNIDKWINEAKEQSKKAIEE